MFCKLLCLSVCRGSVGMRRVLWFFGRGMAKASEGFGDIVWHGEVIGAVCIVPE